MLPSGLNNKVIDYHNQVPPDLSSHEAREQHPVLRYSNYTKTIIQQEQSSVLKTWSLQADTQMYKEITAEIRKICSPYIKSPFAIVNCRSWLSKPGNNRPGNHKKHADGFLEGHLKVMIYPYGLSPEVGEFAIEDQVITDKPPGTCLIFKNSDHQHYAIAGLSKQRLALEITIMRSLIDVPQYHRSSYHGRYLKSPHLIYWLLESKSSDFSADRCKKVAIAGTNITADSTWLPIIRSIEKNSLEIDFNKTYRFPIPDNAVAEAVIDLPSLSLNSKTINNLISEVGRVINQAVRFIL